MLAFSITLKGGRIDYGARHSRAFNVERFGHDFGEGLYPEWNESNPIHLVGHSFGGQSARVLQQMLEDGEFAGEILSSCGNTPREAGCTCTSSHARY